ncbi:MAG: hypothetical protein AAF624_08300 [Bacteroidota bacterium]
MPRLLLLGALLLSGCSLFGDSDDAISSTTVLASGASYGLCFGYCLTDLRVTQDRGVSVATITWSGWTSEVEPVSASRVLTTSEAEALEHAFDRKRLLEAEDVYGCPGCDDGGSEYVELSDGSVEKRVTFEAGADVPGLDAYIAVMRDVRASFAEQAPAYAP